MEFLEYDPWAEFSTIDESVLHIDTSSKLPNL
jgi:hypothetical protein